MFKSLDYLRGTLVIMNVSLMDGYCHWKSKCINHNMFLASFDLFVPVNTLAGRVGIVGSLYASGINDSHVGTLFPAGKSAHERMRRIHDIVKDTLKFPFSKIVIDRLPRTEFSGKKSPLVACLARVKNCIHNVPKRMFSCSFLCVDDFFL